MSKNKQLNDNKKWHQKWWGIIILFSLSLSVIYLGAFIYEVVAGVESVVNLEKQKAFQQYSQMQGINLQRDIKSILETEDDPYLGNKDAELVLVEFADFECPYCKQAYPIIRKIMSEYGNDVKFIYRDLPNVQTHPNSLNAAMAGACAHEQGKFWNYHDKVYSFDQELSVTNLKSLAVSAGLDSEKFDSCLDSQKFILEIQNDISDGSQFNIKGTPTFFIAGNTVPGVISYDTFKMIIDKALSIKSQD